MANLVELSNQLEDFPEQQLVQMSQDPNSMYPSYLVLSEIQRRNQMRKMYEAQQPKPQTTVAEEVIGEFAGQQGLQGAMAQSPGPQDAFPPSDMGNMAPPSPMQAMASGGRTGFQGGGLFGPQNLGTFEEFKEKMIGEYIAATGKSREEAEIFANQNAKQRYSEAVGNSKTPQDNTRRDSLLFTPSVQDSLNLEPLPESLQSKIDEAQELSGLGKFAEAGTQFFFGDARPDADNPTLARATDEFTDYLNIIPGAQGLKLGLRAIKGGKALKQSGKLDEVIDFTKVRADKIKQADDIIDLTKVNPSKIKQADNILPNTAPRTGGTPPAVVPRTGGTPPTSGGPLVPSGGPLVPVIRNVDSVAPRGGPLVPSGGPLVPSGGPLAVVPKVADDVAVKSKGLISKAIDWMKNNPKQSIGYGLLGGLGIGGTAYYSGEPKKDNGTGGTGSTAPTTKEIKRSMDPLDLAKLGGIIMGAKNTSELGQGITALAGDIQERRYKEGVLKSKEEAMLIDRVNSLTKMLDDMNEGTPEYIRTFNARQSLIDSYYGPMAQGTDAINILNANTVGGTDTEDTSSGGLGGALKQSFMAMNPALSLAGMGLKAGYEYLTKDDEVDNTIIPQQDLYNAFIKDAPNPQYLTGDPYIDNIMRIESGGRDVVNDTTGANGPMQVLPSTLIDPGYGVEPAKDDSVEERIRVGADYFNAMKEVFDGDILNATIAFNLGPGATKKWLQAGGTAEELVKIQSSDGRPVGQTALEYIQKAYGPDIINRLS